jgi:hypothetical protein
MPRRSLTYQHPRAAAARPRAKFANADAAETWFEENDPEGVAFEYEALE